MNPHAEPALFAEANSEVTAFEVTASEVTAFEVTVLLEATVLLEVTVLLKETSMSSWLTRPRALVGAAAVLTLVGLNPAVAQTGYYDSVDTTNGATLRATLHEVIDDHQRFPYTASTTDTWDILNLADEDPNNINNVVDVYKNASYTKISGGVGAYNREHSWPKSYGFPNDGSDNSAYTDCHHLFVSDASYNSSRSNRPFRNCSGCTEYTTDFTDGRGGGSGVYPGNSNWGAGSFTQGSWQTWSGRKGDVARAMFYMDLRYEGGSHGGTGFSEPDLRLTDDENLIDQSNTGSNESVAYMGMLSVLLQWHIEDPVDARELYRNEIVYGFQGNRNPFIDNPTWAQCIYQGTNCSGGGSDTTPPAAPTGLAAVGGTDQVSLTWNANGESDLAGYNIYRSTTSGGTYTKLNGAWLTQASYTDSTVTGGTTYYYVVTAVDTSGNISADSAEASATPTSGGGGGGGGGGGSPTGDLILTEVLYDVSSTDDGWEWVEIMNIGSSTVDLSAWSLGNGGTSYTYSVVQLSGSIAPGETFVVGGGSSGSTNSNPTFDQVFNFSPDFQNSGSTADGVALFNVTAASITGSTVPVDAVIYGPSNGSGLIDETGSAGAPEVGDAGAGSSIERQDLAGSWQIQGSPTPNSVPFSAPTNTAPTVSISSPTDGSTVTSGSSVTFTGTASDTEDGDLSASLAWTSSLDGNLGSGASFSTSGLSTGTHTVTAAVTDSGGLSGDATVTITVEIVAPADGDLLLSEVLYDTSGSDDGLEWVEIYNNGSEAVDLSGWSIGGGGTDYTYSLAQLSGTIGAGETFVIGGPTSSATNYNPTFDVVVNFNQDLQNSGTTGDGVALFNVPASAVTASTVPVDAVIYGPNNNSGLVDETGVANAPEVGDAASGSSIERVDLAGNWQIQSAPSPNTSLLGGPAPNTAPSASIATPSSGAVYTDGDTVSFSGSGSDAEDGDVSASLVWTSNLDGHIGTGAAFSTSGLSVGNHTITATATDSGGLTGSDSISLEVQQASGPTTVTFTSIASEDGWVRESSENSSVGGRTNSGNTGSSALRVGDNNKDRQYKAILSFDTSSIPAGATITSVTVRVQRGTVNGTNPFNGGFGNCEVDVQNGAFSGSNSLQKSDFEASATAAGAGVLSNATSNGTWAEAPLGASGLAAINTGGRTQVRLNFQLGDNDDGGNDYTGFYSSDNGTSSRHPQLVVTYQ